MHFNLKNELGMITFFMNKNSFTLVIFDNSIICHGTIFENKKKKIENNILECNYLIFWVAIWKSQEEHKINIFFLYKMQ